MGVLEPQPAVAHSAIRQTTSARTPCIRTRPSMGIEAWALKNVSPRHHRCSRLRRGSEDEPRWRQQAGRKAQEAGSASPAPAAVPYCIRSRSSCESRSQSAACPSTRPIQRVRTWRAPSAFRFENEPTAVPRVLFGRHETVTHEVRVNICQQDVSSSPCKILRNAVVHDRRQPATPVTTASA